MNREFVAKLPQVAVLRKILESIEALIDRFNLDITRDGIEMLSLDSAHVAYARLRILAGAFSEFNTPRNFSMGFDCKNLIKVLKCGSSGSPVEFRALPQDDVLNINFTEQESGVDKHIPIRLQDVPEDRQGIPDVQYPFKVSMSSSRVQNLVDELSKLDAKEVTLVVSSESLKLAFKSDIIAEGAEYVLPTSDSLEITSPPERSITMTFSVKYLGAFLKAAAVAPTVIFTLGEDYPLLVKFEIPEFGSLEWYLAAKVDEAEAGAGMQE